MNMKKASLRKQIFANISWDVFSRIISRGGALIFTIIIARILMPEGYGIYSLTLSIALIFMTFSNMGINMALNRYISYAIANEKEKIASYLKFFFKTKFLLVSIFSILLIILAYPLSFYIFNKPALFLPLLIAGFYIFFLSFENFSYHLFYAIKKVKYLSLKEAVSQILKIIFAIIIFYFIGESYRVAGLFVGLILTSIVLIFISIYYLRKLFPKMLNKAISSSTENIDKKRISKFMSFAVLGSLSTLFFSQVDTIMLGIFVTSEFLGYYQAAFALAFSVTGLMIFSEVLLPYFTQLKNENLKQAFPKVFKYNAMITLPASFGIATLGGYFIRIIYGYDYLPSMIPLIFLSFLVFETTSTYLLGSLFTAKEKPQKYVKYLVAATIINIIFNYILITQFLKYSQLLAITGAAIATIASRYIYFILLYFEVKKDFKIKLNKGLSKIVTSSLIMFIILNLILGSIEDMNLFLGISLIFLGILIYFLILIIFRGFTKEDFNVFKSLIAKN